VVQVEFLWFSGCVHAPTMREAVRAALEGLPHSFRECEQTALPESDPRRLWPSPTILVGGLDLFGLVPDRSSKCALSSPEPWSGACRVYDKAMRDPAVLRTHLLERLATAACKTDGANGRAQCPCAAGSPRRDHSPAPPNQSDCTPKG
jgi:hypothetical protein